MQEAPDIELLRQYAHRNSEEAFAAVVERHVNMVYSAALRKTGNAHAAEEITQAVFIVLAKKAGGLHEKTIVSGWLYQTARLTAANFLRTEIRRSQREQEAYMQSLSHETEAQVWQQIVPLLDDAMGQLSEKDRNALALRFFEGKSFQEVGTAFGASENAAKKRLAYALEKLRCYFLKRGVASTSETIAGAISANAVHAAPAALAKSIAAVAVAKGAVAGGSTLTLAKATLYAMKAKTTIAISTAAAVVLLGTGTYVVCHSNMAHASTAPKETVPLKLANDAFKANADDRFVLGIDPETKRTPDSSPAGHIKSIITPAAIPGSAEYLASLNSTNRPLRAIYATRHFFTSDSLFLGKRIRVSCWIKTMDVRNWAGATLIVWNKKNRIFADDDMTGRPIQGSTDWQQVEFVTDLPQEPCGIYFAPTLYGTGEMWYDDIQVEIVPPDTAVNDNRLWHVWSAIPFDYSQTTDDNTTHNGHPAFCLAYTRLGKVPRGSWMWWGKSIPTPDKYRGHTVRMTVWTKTENVSGRLRPNFVPKGRMFKTLAQDKQLDEHVIRGTTDWTEHSVICAVPKDTDYIDTGFVFFGKGKVWIDMDSIKYEIVKEAL